MGPLRSRGISGSQGGRRIQCGVAKSRRLFLRHGRACPTSVRFVEIGCRGYCRLAMSANFIDPTHDFSGNLWSVSKLAAGNGPDKMRNSAVFLTRLVFAQSSKDTQAAVATRIFARKAKPDTLGFSPAIHVFLFCNLQRRGCPRQARA